MEIDYKEYDFHPFFTIEPDLTDSSKMNFGYYTPHSMSSQTFRHYQEMYWKYRIKPENCKVLYKTDCETLVRGELRDICFCGQFVALPDGIRHEIVCFADDYDDGKFDFYKLKEHVDDYLANPNPEWGEERE